MPRITLLISASALALAGVAHAQSAPPAATPPAPANGAPGTQTTINEVVVTANRVASVAQKTPIALTVYSKNNLATEGVHSLNDLQTVDPSINITSSTGAAWVAIRGIASTDVTEIGDPAVPIARDDFFTNRSYSIGLSMYDLDRVEVLKGPQGTLFGRNSVGGLISIVTQKPTDTFGGYLQVEGGDYDTFNSEGAVNIPLGDKVQLRLSGTTLYHQGYVKQTIINQRGDDDDSQSGRAQLAFEPFDGFRGWVSYQHDQVTDVGDVVEDLPIGVVSPIGDGHSFPGYQPSYNHLIGDRERWEFNYDKLPLGLTLTYAGGYDVEDWHHGLDSTGPALSPLSQFIQHENPATWNHEVRLATPQDQRLTGQVGYFHFSENNDLTSGLRDNTGPYAGGYLVYFPYHVETVSDAVFGQFGYKILDNLELTVGGRYTWDEKTRTGTSSLRCDIAGIPSFLYGIIGCVGTPPTEFTNGDGHIMESRPTYHIGLDWTVAPSHMLYVKYDTGYKSGGFNSNGSAPPVDYGPETVAVAEGGTKNEFFDHRLQLNADVFEENYDGYQASQSTAIISSGSGVFNVGNAQIYGAEAQVIALVQDLGRFDANATWLQTRFGDNIFVADGGGTTHNISGNQLPNAPSFVMTAGFEHPFELPWGVLTARIQGKYSSSFYYDVFNDPDTESPAYATGDIYLTYTPTQGHWLAEIYVRNFTDQTVLANAQRNFTAGWNTYEFQPPLTFGGRLRYNF